MTARLAEAPVILAQDRAVEALGTPIWIGAEPTFTLRESLEPAWLSAAEGADKVARARALLVALAPRLAPAPLYLRSAGRRYPGEEKPRFAFGAWFRRDGSRVWSGPPDPLQRAQGSVPRSPKSEADQDGRFLREARVRESSWPSAGAIHGQASSASGAFRQALSDVLAARGLAPHLFDAGEPRLAVQADGLAIDPGDARLARPGAHAEEKSASDEAAAQGLFIYAFGDTDGVPALELPGFPTVAAFEEALAAIATAAERLGLEALVLRGFPPPVNRDIAWLTVTPDPGVIEVNLAPAPDLATFARYSEAVFAAAAEVGLSAERYAFNGHATDSGGGGQLTFGGPSPEESPFFRFPHLLPGLLRTLNRHPSLSYLFAPTCVGSASQGPRADEGVRERFEELAVTLDRLDDRGPQVDAAELGASLGPLLADGSGNTHRAEVNVEKLWNPGLPGRGKSGLVELRSLRMQASPRRQVALAALFRGLLARIAHTPVRAQLIDRGPALHDRFGLPYFLARDLREVLDDLRTHGLGLEELESELLAEPEPLARLEVPGATLELVPALEFWPLLGDVASQEERGARLFDSSAARLQVLVRAPDGRGPGLVGAAGHEVPLSPADEADVFIAGVRYRAFTPLPGLHPGLPPHDPLELTWSRDGRHFAVQLFGWRPASGCYPGLPADAEEARSRRAERVVVHTPTVPPLPCKVPADRCDAYLLDLRRLPAPARSAE